MKTEHIEILVEAAWQTYLDAGGRLLGQPGTPFSHQGSDSVAAWIKVVQRIGAQVEAEEEIAAKLLAKVLSDIYYTRLTGQVVFRDFDRQALSEQLAWEAVGRQCFQIASTFDDDEAERVPHVRWSDWAREQTKKRGLNVSVQDA